LFEVIKELCKTHPSKFSRGLEGDVEFRLVLPSWNHFDLKSNSHNPFQPKINLKNYLVASASPMFDTYWLFFGFPNKIMY
jgi:hypothetical protein